MSQRLSLAFDDPAALIEEFEKNLSKGGALVRTEAEPPLRSIVEVEVELSFASRRFVWEAEVVAVLPGTGVAVQFQRPAADLRDELESVVAGLSGRSSPPPAPPAPPPARADDDLELDELDDLLGDSRPPAATGAGPAAKRTAAAPADDPLSGVGDRRRSPRAPARVPVRLASADGGFDGRTRDLSETGVLVSGDATELPIGAPVRVELQGPDGRSLEVPGRVSRHVHHDGTVTAVGIAFEPAQELEARLSGFVRQIKEQAHERVADGIAGRIEELGLPNLLQMLGASSRGGTLTVVAGSEEGVLAFEDATLRYVRQGPLRGAKALERMLSWSTGTFHFHGGIDPLPEEDEPMPLATALFEAARRLDEARAGAPLALAPATSFRVAGGDLPAELAQDQTALAVLDLARAGMNVRRILDVIPESDAEVRRAIQALLEAGSLVARR